MISLSRADLVLPADAMSDDRVAYIHVRNPKTARFARRQHCRLEDSLSLLFLEALLAHLPLQAQLYRGSMFVYRTQ